MRGSPVMPAMPNARDNGLEIRLLGPVELIQDGQSVALPVSRKLRGLLAYLALALRPCPRADLCDLLWEEVADPRAELRWALSRLRAVLGPRLIASRDTIALSRDGLRVDAVEVRALDLTELSEARVRDALTRWRGMALTDADVPTSPRFHAWWAAEHEALTQIRLRLHERLVGLLRAQPEAALSAARQMAANFPFDEVAHLAVAQALAAAGRREAATEYLQQARLGLSIALGIPASEVMRDAVLSTTEPRSPEPTRRDATPRLLISELKAEPDHEDVRAVAVRLHARLGHELRRSQMVGVVAPAVMPMTNGSQQQNPSWCYRLHGSLTRVGGRLTLSLGCSEFRTSDIVWSEVCTLGSALRPYEGSWLGRVVSDLCAAIERRESLRAGKSQVHPGESGPTRLRRAASLVSRAEFQANGRAMSLLEALLVEDPDQPLALALLAWCRAQRVIYNWSTNQTSDRDESMRLIRQASMLGIDNPMCLTILAAARSQISDQIGAGALLERSLRLYPHSAAAHTRQGFVGLYLDEPTRALRHFRAALGLTQSDPSTFNAYVGTGIAYFLKGEARAGVRWMEIGLALNPSASWVYRNLVPAYVEAGMMAEAEDGVRKLRADYPTLSVVEVDAAMSMTRPAMARICTALARAGLPLR